MRCGSSNRYELIFPRLYDEEKNQHYEVLIQKANDIWDEFTTGAKGKKKAAETAAEKEKAELAAKKASMIKKNNRKIIKINNDAQKTLEVEKAKTEE